MHTLSEENAQAFAGHGYAALIMNVPKNTFIYKDGDFAEPRAADADGVASAIRSAIDLLIGRGIVYHPQTKIYYLRIHGLAALIRGNGKVFRKNNVWRF